MKHHSTQRRPAFALSRVLVGLLTVVSVAATADLPEVDFPGDDFKRLDTFEAHVLSKADQAFRKGDHRLAAKEYDAFIMEFPRSDAIAYALLRKGRCLQQNNKRFEAIKEYQEVLDYFPNQVRYAAAALYYQGVCHQQNQDIDKALIAWTRMAEDVDYRKHFLAGRALKELADNLLAQRRTAEAMKYYRMVLANFRQQIDRRERRDAIDKLTRYYVRWNPDVEELGAVYVDIRGFHDRRPLKNEDIPEAPLEDGRFWTVVMKLVREYGDFDKFHESEEKTHYRYWSKAMEERFPNWDGFQLTRADFELRVHGDIEKWYRRVDGVYANGLTEENHDKRTVEWVKLYAHHESKAKKYLDKLDPKSLNGKLVHQMIHALADAGQKEVAVGLYPWVNPEHLTWDEKRGLMHTLYQKLHHRDMAHNFFAKLQLGKADDKEKERMAHTLSNYDEELVMKCYDLMEDVDRGNFLRLKYYRHKEDIKKGLEIAPKVIQAPDYASIGWWYKAELHDMARQWQQALNAYRQSDRPPDSLFRIAEDYMRMGKLENAVTQLREIEKFFEKHNAEAALKVGQYYRRAGKRDEEIASLLHVMKKYPRSGQSRHAHERLEELGVDMRGGVDQAVNN